MRLIKITVSSATESNLYKKISASGNIGEEITERPYFQHRGFTSLPKEDDLAVALVDGNQVTLIGSVDSLTTRPELSSEGDVAIYVDTDKYVKIEADGKITVKNNNSTITLKANGDIELGTSSLDSLVKSAVLSTLAAHTHPVSGAVAGVSTDTGMVALATAPGNKTQSVEAE